MLPFVNPYNVAGGWGCVVCGLPQRGAIAVYCEPCAQQLEQNPEAEAQWLEHPVICVDHASENRRVQVERYLLQRHEHDMAKHDKANTRRYDVDNDSDGPPDLPQTLIELLWYCRYYERDIFVRAKRDDGWGNVALGDLEPFDWAETITRFVEKGIIPVRVRRETEDEPRE